jgi:CheY-like chemotaxis protein
MAWKILVIDDDRTFVRFVRSCLEALHYEVIPTFDGNEGMEKLKEKNPDLIILDIEMPKMDGYTFLLEIRKLVHAREIPIVIITAKEGMRDIFKMEGVSEYIVKPINAKELIDTVQKYLPDNSQPNA